MTLKLSAPKPTERAGENTLLDHIEGLPAWLERVRCPRTKLGGWSLGWVGTELENGLPRDGYLVNEHAGTVYNIRGGILDLALPIKPNALTLAGWSNHVPPTPQIYERIWRTRALSLMTGSSFPLERELALVNEWTDVKRGEVVLDVGTSTGLYARGLAATPAAPTIFAVDLSAAMLREARGYIPREGRKGIVLMRAAAEYLPFHDASLDAVVVGGSLNEMKLMSVALRESYRVTRQGGRMFVMSLSRAASAPGRLLQRFLQRGGLKFPSVADFNAMTQAEGWTTAKQESNRIVLFTLLTK